MFWHYLSDDSNKFQPALSRSQEKIQIYLLSLQVYSSSFLQYKPGFIIIIGLSEEFRIAILRFTDCADLMNLSVNVFLNWPGSISSFRTEKVMVMGDK